MMLRIFTFLTLIMKDASPPKKRRIIRHNNNDHFVMQWITNFDGGPKRVNHAAVAVGHRIYSFGGYCTGENSREYTSMDVHVLNTTTFRWTKHPVSDLPYFENDDILPYKRYGHTAVVYGEKVYIWGGRNDRTSDGVLFCFDTNFSCWTAPKITGRTIPLPRDGHTACRWRHYMYVYGGYEEDSDSYAENVYALDLDKMEWRIIKTQGDARPQSRDFHTAVCLGDRMFVFGGRSTNARTNDEIYSNTLWYLDLLTNTWHIPKVRGRKPKGRRSHSAFVYEEKMYIFGGFNAIEGEHYNDMYCLDPKTMRWSYVRCKGDQPCKRRRQACIVVDNRLFLFGGTSPHDSPSPFHLMFDVDRLVDHCDMYVLEFKPTLKTLCMKVVNEHKLDESVLPATLRNEMSDMFSPKKITVSRPNNSAG